MIDPVARSIIKLIKKAQLLQIVSQLINDLIDFIFDLITSLVRSVALGEKYTESNVDVWVSLIRILTSPEAWTGRYTCLLHCAIKRLCPSDWSIESCSVLRTRDVSHSVSTSLFVPFFFNHQQSSHCLRRPCMYTLICWAQASQNENQCFGEERIQAK